MQAPYVYVARLPRGIKGLYDLATHSIWLDNRLTPRQERCTLQHELIHAERGDTDPGDPWLRQRQERVVHQEAARRLIPVEQLAEAIAWAEEANELAECLDVDLVTLQARLDSLSEAEARYLRALQDARGCRGC